MNYILSATLQMKDEMTPAVQSAQKSLNGMKTSLSSASKSAGSATESFRKIGNAASSAAPAIEKMQSALKSASRNYTASFTLRDRASQVINRVTSRLNGFKGKTYTAILNVKNNITGGNGPLGGLKEKASGVASGMLMGLPVQAAGTIGMGYGVFDAVKKYSAFTAELSNIKAVTGLDDDAMAQVKARALELGAATQYSSTEAAQGMTELLKAGVDVKDVLGDASQAALDLAAAGGIKLPEAAEIMSTAMNAFHIDNATHAADTLTAAANASATGVEELRYSLAAVSSVAAGVGLSFDDTNTALAVFANNGLKGSDAGTSLKTMLSNLTPQTDSAAKEFSALGLMTEKGTSKFFDAEGRMKSIAEIADILQGALAGMTNEEKMNHLYKLFGSDAIRGGMIFAREGGKGVRDMQNAMSKITAHGTAEVAMDNLSGSIKKFTSAWDNMEIKLLDGKAGNGIKGFVDEITDLTSAFGNSLDDGFQFTDLLSIIGKGISDLKNKFLQMDGIGSVLAGGALAAGLYKISKLSVSAVKSIKSLTSVPKGLSGAGNIATAKDMMVNANTVIVNGKVSPGNGPSSTPVPGVPEKGGKNGMTFAAGKWVNRALVGLSLLSAGYDIYNASPEERGATALRAGGQIAGTVVGSHIGGAIGTAILPGVGTVAGATIGGMAGGFLGNVFGDHASGGAAVAAYSNPLETTNDSSAYTKGTEAYTEKVQELHKSMWDSVKAAASEALDNCSARAVEAFNGFLDDSRETTAAMEDDWSQTPPWFESTVWDPIANAASGTGDAIADAFASAWGTMQGIWSGAADWFNSTVAAPISQAVSQLGQNRLAAIQAEIAGDAPADAAGTTFASGGLTQINEHGGELIDLPQGSRVYPAGETARIIRNEVENISRGGNTVTVTGNTFVIRNEADVDSIAYKIAQALEQGYANYGGA